MICTARGARPERRASNAGTSASNADGRTSTGRSLRRRSFLSPRQHCGKVSTRFRTALENPFAWSKTESQPGPRSPRCCLHVAQIEELRLQARSDGALYHCEIDHRRRALSRDLALQGLDRKA